MIAIDAVEKPPGIAAVDLDLAEGRASKRATGRAPRGIPPYRLVHVLDRDAGNSAGASIADILENRARGDMQSASGWTRTGSAREPRSRPARSP